MIRKLESWHLKLRRINLSKYNLTNEQLNEATNLAEVVLKNIELSELPLSSIALRAARLCRLLGLNETRKLFEFEVSGYPKTPTGVEPEIWRIAVIAGRTYKEKDGNDEIKEYAYIESIDTLEEQVKSSNAAINVTNDPNVSVSSTNPYQRVSNPTGNKAERSALLTKITKATKHLSERKTFIYKFALERYLELKFSNQVSDFFTSTRREVDARLTKYLPEATEKLSSILDNLKSENSEDWSNAVHSCRRLLQSVADKVFPPSNEPRKKGDKTISLKADNYINRLVCFAEDHSKSTVFNSVVGSNIAFLGDRLDAIFSASQKGSHSEISSRSEAERYVVYTYMILGDILTLADSHNSGIGENEPNKVSEESQAKVEKQPI